MAGIAEKIFRLHLAQLQRLTDGKGVAGVQSLYKRTKDSLESRLRGYGPGDESLTPVALRSLLSQVDGVIGEMGDGLEEHLTDVGALASRLGARHGVDEFKLLEKFYTGTEPILDLDKASVFENLVDGHQPSLLRRYERVTKTWSNQAIGAIEQKLSVSAMSGMHLEDAIDDVMDAGGILDTERWKAERIVRTEMSYAHGVVKHGAMERIKDDQAPELQKKLIEMVDDDRVGDDSLVIHGQVVSVDEPFTWKRRRGKGWSLEEFMHPPNRPNDRAVVVPWQPEWKEGEGERALTISELRSAPPTRWRSKPGVKVPPGHKPGKSYLSRSSTQRRDDTGVEEGDDE